MSEFIVEQQPLPDPNDLYNKGKEEIKDVRELVVGAGSNIFYTDKEGSRWGNIVFDDAKAYIKMDGSFKFKASDGTVLIDSLGGGTGDYINIINSALDSSSRTILSDWTFESTDYAGAFKSGSITWSTTTGLVTGGTGIVINDRGIIGAASGVATFTIDATTGNATFAGTLVAASGTLGSITIGSNAWHVDSSGNMWWGNFASYADATIKISSSGSVDFSTGNIIGATIKATSSTSGANVFLDPANKRISFLYDNSEKGLLYCDSSGNVVLDADDGLFLTANGSGDDIFLTAGDDILVDCNEYFLVATGGVFEDVDGYASEYNTDNNGADYKWYSNANERMSLNQSGDLTIAGDFSGDNFPDFAEYFEAIEEFSDTKIPDGTTVVMVNGKIRPALSGEIPFGVISGAPGIILGSHSKEWSGKYIRSEFGKFLTEEAEWWKAEIIELDEKKDGRKKPRRKKVSGWTDRDNIPKGAINIKKKLASRQVINPDWDAKKKYVPRKNRPEWNIVGLLGQIRVIKGQPTAPQWIKLRDISPTVEEWLIR